MDLFNPKKSPFLYVLAFMLAVPALVYAVAGPTFELSEASGDQILAHYINIAAPLDGAELTVNQPVTISLSGEAEAESRAFVAVDGVVIPGCEFDGLLGVFPRAGEPPTTCTWTPTSGQSGKRTIKAEMTPKDSGVIPPVLDEITVNVVAVNIDVRWTKPTQGSTISGTTGLKWTVTGLSGTSGVTYAIYLDGSGTALYQGLLSDACSSVDSENCTVSGWDTTTVSNGAHSLNVIVTNLAGNNSDTVSFNVNNVANDNRPTCLSIDAASGVDSGQTFSVTAYGQDDNNNLLEGKIEYGDGVADTKTPDGSGKITSTHAYTITESSKTFTIRASFKDAGGYGSSCERNITVTRDSDADYPPTITSTPSKAVRAGSAYSYALEATDDKSTVTKSAAKVPSWATFVGGRLSGTPSVDDAGVHQAKLYVSDGVNANVYQNFAITVYTGDIEGVDVSPPTVELTFPAGGSQISCGDSTVQWTITDDGTIESIKLEYSTDDETWVEISSTIAVDATSYDWDVCGLEVGEYYLKLTATDDTGVPGADFSEPFEVIEAGDVMAGPSISDLTPAKDSKIKNKTPEISAAFTPQGSDVAAATVRIWVNDTEVTAVATIDADGVAYTPSEALSIGEQTVKVVVSDEAGRLSSVEWTFEVAGGWRLVQTLGWFWFSLLLLLIIAVIAGIVYYFFFWKKRKEDDKGDKKDAGKKPKIAFGKLQDLDQKGTDKLK